MKNINKVVMFLMGPTASGKTDLAIELAKIYPIIDIISVDSVMVYRDFNIGTSKPPVIILDKYPHKLINIRNPIDSYSVADFYKDALYEITASINAGRLPLLVGGTMMYFKTLQNGLSKLPAANNELRKKLLTLANINGISYLHDCLTKIDPISAKRINPHDKQRIFRGLEIYLSSKIPWSKHLQANKTVFPFPNVLNFAIAPTSRQLLHEIIEKRFLKMLDQGWIQEVINLKKKWPNINNSCLHSVGYRQIFQYLDGEYSYKEMLTRGIAATRQLAKRQFTWLRSLDNLQWLDPVNLAENIITIKKYLQ